LVIRYTGAGARSTRDVRTHLTRHGVGERLAARAVAEARVRGLVDDRACARLWANHWARQGYAWSAIRLKLAAKGLEGQAVDDAARDVGAASDDDRAQLIVERVTRAGTAGPMRGRLARALALRGFDAELIERILDQAAGPPPPDAQP